MILFNDSSLGAICEMWNESDEYSLFHGDCIPHMVEEMEPESMDLAVFSPPFPSLFAYTSEEADIGNSEDLRGEAKVHLGFFYTALRRVVKPGRVIVVHVMQIPRLARSGERGLHDFRGLNIRMGERAGLVYEYDWLVRKNPQAQAIRTHSHALLFATMDRDRAASRGALGDYLIKFTVPGDNAVSVRSDEITREQWIEWAEACWSVKETNTLNTREAKGDDDQKHICPLQLDVIERLVLLYSNPGEIVFSPFAGIGSEGYIAMLRSRRFYGCELKDAYYETAIKNLDRALERRKHEQTSLWDLVGVDENVKNATGGA